MSVFLRERPVVSGSPLAVVCPVFALVRGVLRRARPSMRVVVVGASGLIGTAVSAALQAQGHLVTTKRAPRPNASPAAFPDLAADAWEREQAPQRLALLAALARSDAVVVAAGCAQPGARHDGQLHAANVVVPLLVYRAARDAGVPHVVHVSSAAVQGDREILDETTRLAPFSPYSRSKALAETTLGAARQAGGPTLTLYRPTSVMAPGRGITQALVRHAKRRVVPYVGPGTQPLPLVHLDSVGAACARLASVAYDGIALHPWEGLNVLTVLRWLGAGGRMVRVPGAVVGPTLSLLGFVTSPYPPARSAVRRAHLFSFGQAQRATVLPELGFAPEASETAYRRLATQRR